MVFYQRKSLRLKEYDYAQGGYYFVTICTYDRLNLFGHIDGECMRMNQWGKTVEGCWQEVIKHFPSVTLDEYVIMPNHIHGIIVINGDDFGENDVGARSPRPNSEGGGTPPLHPTLGRIIAYFKYQSTKRINGMRHVPGMYLWQRNYYEHIIRNDVDLDRIREYIRCNPIFWQDDEYNK